MPLAPEPANRYACGGAVESEAWAQFDDETHIRRYIHDELLDQRLYKSYDVYALYDLQLVANNLLAMAERCGRGDRLRELISLVDSAFGALEATKDGLQWVCRGGSICTDNGLIGVEVDLPSAQFLGLALQAAGALVRTSAGMTPSEQRFVETALEVATDHMLRWGGTLNVRMLEELASKTKDDVTGRSSELFFLDEYLWQIVIYSEMATVRKWLNDRTMPLPEQLVAAAPAMDEHFAALLRLFNARTSVARSTRQQAGPMSGDIEVADLDKGFWRLARHNDYAGYEGSQPVVCNPGPQEIVRPSETTRRADTGWDFSHSRRLVQGIAALERNRSSISEVYGIPQSMLSAPTIGLAFSGQLMALIWNGSQDTPLFANYWSGANGWYRARLDAGTCDEGILPYGLSESFLTGGYVTWGKYFPQIKELGVRMYELIKSDSGAASSFMVTYYEDFSSAAERKNVDIAMLMFLPTLVGISDVAVQK